MSMKFLKRMFNGAGEKPSAMANSFDFRLFPSSQQSAENLAAVYGCVTAISSAISALPVFVYQKRGKARQELNTGEVFDLIQRGPNLYQTWPEFCEMLVAQTLLRGNGLVEIETEVDGTLTGLRVIPWDWCTPMMLSNGRMVYDVFDQPGIWSPAQGHRRRLLDHQVVHVRDRSDDGLIGQTRLQRCVTALDVATEANEMARAWYQNGLNPSAILSTIVKLNPVARDMIREGMTDRHAGGRNAGKLLILDGGEFNLQKLSISPEDAELLESRKFSVEEICRIFQVPPPIIQDYSHNTFTNSEQAGRWFAQFCLLPWVRKLEAAFNRALFPDGQMELVLDMSGFDRGDPATRWQNHAIAASNGILDVNEIREIEGFSPKVHQNTSGNTSNEIF